MPFNAEQLEYAGKHVIDYFQRNTPVDQVNTERPLLKKMVEGKKNWAGGLQNVVEQLRFSNSSNFQAYFGDSQVSYNRKRTLDQAKFTWGSFHDGFGLNEDEAAQNGITLSDDRNAVPSDAEKVQLTNLLNENMETLKLGFQENFDKMIHRDGTQSAIEIPGLDHLISVAPATGVVGGIDAATQPLWRNYANTAMTVGTAETFIQEMEIAWRECTRRGGSRPDFILVGSAFMDAYMTAAKDTVNRDKAVSGRRGADMDASLDGVFFKGVPLTWDPVFDDLDDEDSPSIEWAKRCYFINTRHMYLRPIAGHWMVSRKPPRVYDRYVHYWAMTAKAAMTTNKRNAHAVLAFA